MHSYRHGAGAGHGRGGRSQYHNHVDRVARTRSHDMLAYARTTYTVVTAIDIYDREPALRWARSCIEGNGYHAHVGHSHVCD